MNDQEKQELESIRTVALNTYYCLDTNNISKDDYIGGFVDGYYFSKSLVKEAPGGECEGKGHRGEDPHVVEFTD